MLLKACNKCGNLIPYGKAYCDNCRAIVDREREERERVLKREGDRRYNKGRDPRVVKFYNSTAWRMLAARYTQDKEYRCEECGAIASQVHHIEPIQTPNGWNRRLDYDNLKLLCLSCHNKEHKRFQKRNQNQK